MRISDWSSDVCSSDLATARAGLHHRHLGLDARRLPGPGQGGGDCRSEAPEGRGSLQCHPVQQRDPCALPPAGGGRCPQRRRGLARSEEHTSELQSLMRISYAVFCLKKKNTTTQKKDTTT